MTEPLHHHEHHDPTNYGMVSSPHGPETGDDHESLRLRGKEWQQGSHIFEEIMYPADMYTPEGKYWADLPLLQQLKFNASVDNAEAKKELGQIRVMMKKSFFSPVTWYFKNAVLPGAGLGLEGSVSTNGMA